jgi:hypothetical protein
VVADATDAQNLPHVRSSNSSLAALITRATEESTTFRGLIDAINVSDGIVYVESGRCRYSRACLVGVTGLGRYRILRVSVVLRHADTDLMAFIGHELQHAIEILSNPHVRNTEDMYLFYSRIGTRGKGSLAFETTAAIKAGDAVREELRAFQSRTTGRASREDRYYHSRPTEREVWIWRRRPDLNRRWRFCRPAETADSYQNLPIHSVPAQRPDLADVVPPSVAFPEQHQPRVLRAFRVGRRDRMPTAAMRAVKFVASVNRPSSVSRNSSASCLRRASEQPCRLPPPPPTGQQPVARRHVRTDTSMNSALVPVWSSRIRYMSWDRVSRSTRFPKCRHHNVR